MDMEEQKNNDYITRKTRCKNLFIVLICAVIFSLVLICIEFNAIENTMIEYTYFSGNNTTVQEKNIYTKKQQITSISEENLLILDRIAKRINAAPIQDSQYIGYIIVPYYEDCEIEAPSFLEIDAQLNQDLRSMKAEMKFNVIAIRCDNERRIYKFAQANNEMLSNGSAKGIIYDESSKAKYPLSKNDKLENMICLLSGSGVCTAREPLKSDNMYYSYGRECSLKEYSFWEKLYDIVFNNYSF